MWKIDLHTHTKKCVDGEKINFNPELAIDKLINNEVICFAITNHFTFDYEQFQEINKENENQGNKINLILPGVEVDTYHEKKEKRRQINIIVNPKDAKKFEEKIKDIYEKDKKSLSFKEIISSFDSFNPIYSIDAKSGKTKFDLSEIEEFKKITKNIVIHDFSNNTSSLVYSNHGYTPNFTFSDVKDWDGYDSLAKKLVSSRVDIKNFEELKRVLEHGKSNGRKSDFLELKDCKEELEKKWNENEKINFPILNHKINIIFGNKGTGKTEILEEIYNQKKINQDTCVEFYKSNEIKKKIWRKISRKNKRKR